MGCLTVGIALLVPRAAMVVIWLLTDWFGRAYETALWPLVGFFLMPYTTLAYMAAMLNNAGSVSGLWLVLVVVAAIVDIGHWGEGGRKVTKARRRKPRKR